VTATQTWSGFATVAVPPTGRRPAHGSGSRRTQAANTSDLVLWIERAREVAAGDSLANFVKVCGCVLGAITTSVGASGVYQAWAGLTDRYERGAKERGAAEALMRRAAREREPTAVHRLILGLPLNRSGDGLKRWVGETFAEVMAATARLGSRLVVVVAGIGEYSGP
jgi:hypothetical protein